MRKGFSVLRLIYIGLVVGAQAFAGSGEGAMNATSARTRTTRTSTSTRTSAATPTFTLDQAILTALQRNPSIQNAKEEIERSKGVILQIGAEALPHVVPTASLQWTSPGLSSSLTSTTSTVPGVSPTPVAALAAASPTPAATTVSTTDTSYVITITGTQLVFNYSTFRSIRGTFFQRDNAYFAFRDIIDQVIATVKTQFYQIILNKALIGVQEQSVGLLESQLKDQQTRFEAGTVPRFNVLQAQVALSNQIPNLIAARNNYRISQLQPAKTLGLDFNPRRGENPPLEVEGEMQYIPRTLALVDAIELGKQRRPFLKRQRAAVLNQIEQVHVALGSFLPNFGAVGGYEIFSSPTTTSFEDASK